MATAVLAFYRSLPVKGMDAATRDRLLFASLLLILLHARLRPSSDLLEA